eukprot:7897966-Pyramimonas_sp.AAC.1
MLRGLQRSSIGRRSATTPPCVSPLVTASLESPLNAPFLDIFAARKNTSRYWQPSSKRNLRTCSQCARRGGSS